MRLNLNPGVSAYTLIANAAPAQSVVIHARPAFSHVIEQAKADPSIQAMVDDIRAELAAEGAEVVITPELMQSRGLFGVLFSKAIARQVIESWEGIEDPDGSPAPVTPDRIDALLDIVPLYDAFNEKYLGRWLLLQTEKNDSAPSPAGTSAVAQNTAGAAPRRAKTAPKS